MSDLISRSALIDCIRMVDTSHPFDDKEDILEQVLGIIDEQATAYDLENVIREIHDYFKKVIDDSESDNISLEVLTYNKDICEIVRKGGVNHVEPQCMQPGEFMR